MPMPISRRAETLSNRWPRTGEIAADTPESTVMASINTIRLGLNSAPSGTASTLYDEVIIEVTASSATQAPTWRQPIAKLPVIRPSPAVAAA